MPSDAMPLKVYDGDTSTNISTTVGTYYRMKIDSSVEGDVLMITGSGDANGFSFRDANLKVIGSEVESPATLTIPEGAKWIYYRKTYSTVSRFNERSIYVL
jgi:hypothetical protein